MGCASDASEHPLVSRQAQREFLLPRLIRMGGFLPLGRSRGAFRLRENRAWAFPGRCDQPVGQGGRSYSMLREQPVPALGSGRDFPLGQIGTGPQGLLASSAAWSIPTCQVSAPFGQVAACSHTTDVSLCPALGGGRLLFPVGGLGSVPGVFLPPSAALSTARTPLGQCGCVAAALAVVVASPGALHLCGGKLSLPPGSGTALGLT